MFFINIIYYNYNNNKILLNMIIIHNLLNTIKIYNNYKLFIIINVLYILKVYYYFHYLLI